MGSAFVNANNTKHRPDGVYSKVINDINKHGVCPFCSENLAKYHKNPILHETEHWLATNNMYPYEGAKHHVLLIHKTHVQHIHELSAKAWKELREVINHMVDANDMKGSALMVRFGDTAYTGASVTHLHAHLVSGSGDQDAKPVIMRFG